MTPEQRQAARERCEAATEQLCVVEIAGEYHLMAGWPFGDTVAVFQGDKTEVYAEFCAHARRDLPAALDEIDRLEGEVERLREALKWTLQTWSDYEAVGSFIPQHECDFGTDAGMCDFHEHFVDAWVAAGLPFPEQLDDAAALEGRE